MRIKSFDEYIKENCYQNKKGLNIISVNEVMGAWHECVKPLIDAYDHCQGNMSVLGIDCEEFLRKMKLI